MICCKIITDYNSANGNLNKLLQKLINCGNFLWENNNLYFSNTDDYSVDQKKIAKILKNSGYNNFFINVYDKEHTPNENEMTNGWITEQLIKINYACYEDQSQKLFSNISKGLDMLDTEINRLQTEKENLIKEAESDERRKEETNG